MSIEESIDECVMNASMLNKYEPDLNYVDHFFRRYLDVVEEAYLGILEEANRDFGLFAPQCDLEEFKKKCIEKNDPDALEFVEWYEKKIREEHKDYYPSLMYSIMQYYKHNKKLPKVEARIKAINAYKGDMTHAIPDKLMREDMGSDEVFKKHMWTHIEIFLDRINNKRAANGEPKVPDNGMAIATYFKNFDNFEIKYAADIYIQVIRRIVTDSRNKIRESTKQK